MYKLVLFLDLYFTTVYESGTDLLFDDSIVLLDSLLYKIKIKECQFFSKKIVCLIYEIFGFGYTMKNAGLHNAENV